MFRVIITFDGRRDCVGPPYKTKIEADRAIARWCALNYCEDKNFAVEEEFGPPAPERSNLAAAFADEAAVKVRIAD